MSHTTGRITGAQLRKLYAVCKATNTDMDDIADRFYGRKPGFLTIEQASGLITNLELLAHSEREQCLRA